MSITKVSKYVLEDGSVTLEKLSTPSYSAGQVLTVDGLGNLLFTDKLVNEDVEDIVAGMISSGTHTNITITYNDTVGSLSFNASGGVTSVNGNTGAVTLTSTDIAEGTNLYFTNTRSRSAISVTDAGGDGTLVYNSSTGVITYTGPSAADVRAHFSAGTGISIANGQISIGQNVATTSNVTFHNISATGDATIDGNLTVSGTTFTVNATELAIEDNLIYLNEGSTITNPDLGWVGNYNDGTYAHTGVFRDSTDGVFKLFDSYTPEPGQSIDTAHASFNLAPLAVGSVSANYFTGDGANLTSVLTNYSTTDLVEGTNLYYTSARAESDIQTYLTTSTNQDAIVAGSLTLGNAVTLSESVDRPDLLSIVSSTVGNGGLQIANNNGEGLWSFMTNDTKLYIYDDKYEKIHVEFTENAGSVFRHNGSAKFSTRTWGVQVEGDVWLNAATFTNLNHAVTRGWVENRIASDLSVLTTDDITEGTTNLYWTTTRGNTNFATNLAASTTDNLAEGSTNLYYTDARVDARLATLIVINDTSEFGGLSYNPSTGNVDFSSVTTSEIRNTLTSGTGVSYDNTSGIISIGQDVGITSNVTFNNITSSGNIVVQGNLTVSGTTTTVNTQELLIADNIITLNSDVGAATQPVENAGIEVNRGIQNDVGIRWNEIIDAWQFTNDGITYQNIGSLSASDTDDLAEGTSNLYYTNERVDDRVNALLQAGTNISLSYNDTANTLIISSNSTGGYDLSNNTTDNLSEGTNNLYYTVSRARSSISVSGDLVYNSSTGVMSFDLGDHSTSELPEGTNLYYTNTRADARVNLLRTDLETSGSQSVHFDNLTNVPVVTTQLIAATGSSTYTMSSNPGSADGAIITISGVTQTPGSDYTVSGTTLTFSTNIPTGNSILIRYVGYQVVGGSAPAGVSSSNDLPITGGTMSGSILVATDNAYDLGSAGSQWRTIYGHEIEATYADLAERYASDAPYEPGTVVVFGGEAEITTTTIDLDVAVAGVISTNPALKLNSQAGNSQTHPYVALRGRVPCKVVGPVRKGDLLVTSTVAGHAMSVGKNDHGRSVFAKSITEDLRDGTKIVEVVII